MGDKSASSGSTVMRRNHCAWGRPHLHSHLYEKNIWNKEGSWCKNGYLIYLSYESSIGLVYLLIVPTFLLQPVHYSYLFLLMDVLSDNRYWSGGNSFCRDTPALYYRTSCDISASDRSRWPSRPIRSLSVTCTRIRTQAFCSQKRKTSF